ncbi:MAG: gamma-glutamyltransferase [Bryobacteraceae bacterium]|nr:gamma-glutamyltransferase [Bryobacteraceae bacterium]
MRVLAAAGLTLILMDAAFSQDRDSARSMVLTERGVVAASQTLAAQAGSEILRRGGSAVDAAIAANAVLGVVEPMMNGIGGDLFVIVREAKTGRVTGLNASGPAPAGLTIERLKKAGHKEMPQAGIDTVTVPGCVAGWAALHQRYGKLPWAQVFAPAIHYAENGFPVTEIIAAQWASPVKKLEGDADGAAVYLPGGKAPGVGEVFRNPELARALREIAAEGPDAFYRGGIARAILQKSDKLGGTLSLQDLAAFEPEWVEPVSTDYRGWRVWELPPNSQGIAALAMLNIMERFELGKLSPSGAPLLHLEIEAQKLAYADLARYVADPRVAPAPVTEMLDKGYAARRAELIRQGRAACDVPPGRFPLPGEGDTIYLSAADEEGNLVSLIQSIYLSFGSGIGVPGYGFHLHNRAGLFTLEEGHPNALAPGKRPFHTIIPALMEKDERHIAFGIMGGLNQAQAHAQFVSRVVDHGMNVQQALEAPRFTRTTFGGCGVLIENRIPAAEIRTLQRWKHEVKTVGAYSNNMGGGQAVEWNHRTGVKAGASSPRKDGAAIPQPDAYLPE